MNDERVVRVLVVDDSVVLRRLFTVAIESTPGFAAAGATATGRLALSRIGRVEPDLVLVDLELPALSGVETVKAIRDRHPDLPVIALASEAELDGEAAREALLLGASAVLQKPEVVSPGDPQALAARLMPELSRVLGFARPMGTSPPAPLARASLDPRFSGRPSLRTSPANPPPPQILAIGSSTGGPNALAQVIRDLGDDWPLPVVVTQHMPPKFTAMLAQRLDKLTALEVKEAEDGDALQPGRVLVAKGDYHLTFVNEGSAIYARLSKTAPEHSCRPAVDVMLRSLMSIYGNRILAVILTGMGQDGCASSAALYQRGGRVIVQDAETSVVWGMPGAVAAAGIADQVLPVHAIGRAAWSTLRPPPRSVAPATLQEMTR